jgi:hypothetical protein
VHIEIFKKNVSVTVNIDAVFCFNLDSIRVLFFVNLLRDLCILPEQPLTSNRCGPNSPGQMAEATPGNGLLQSW